MARMLGVDIPNEKVVKIAITCFYGIGRKTAEKICAASGVDGGTRVKDLSDEQISAISSVIKTYKIEGDLRREVSSNIKRLTDINCYRGIRHKKGLPVRGQRTKTNARTRKGPRKTIANKKQASQG